MPVPNDLSPEEEAEFANHGVAPAGPGSEPVIENASDVQQREGQQDDGSQQDDGQQGRQPLRRENGQFMSAEEVNAAQRSLQGAGQQASEQGQQQEGSEAEPKMVPLNALHEARARERQLAQRLQLATTRMNQMITSQPPQRQEAQMPDLNEDPAGYIRAMEQRLERFEQGWQQDRETRTIDTSIENDEAAFSAVQPDYNIASDYYVQSRAKELLQFYPPQQAQQLLMNEAREIAKQSWQRNMSAAETVYNLAVARGYNPNRVRQPVDEGQQQQGQQQGQRTGPTAQALVEGVRQGQGASRSLSNGAGGREAALNAEALLSMSDEEFEATLGLGKKGANANFANL